MASVFVEADGVSAEDRPPASDVGRLPVTAIRVQGLRLESRAPGP